MASKSDISKQILAKISNVNVSNKKFAVLSEKFINLLMIHGKKSKASKIFNTAGNLLRKKLMILKQKQKPAMSSLVYRAIINVKPILEVRKVRIGRMTYQVPAIIPQKRRETLAIRWILESARKRKTNSNLTLANRLAQELLEAYSKQGQARQKRDSLHKLAESNRTSLHYRWW